jgi:hypothetical protein
MSAIIAQRRASGGSETAFAARAAGWLVGVKQIMTARSIIGAEFRLSDREVIKKALDLAANAIIQERQKQPLPSCQVGAPTVDVTIATSRR